MNRTLFRSIRRLIPLAALILSPVVALADVAALRTLPDFKIEEVLSADKVKHGSWISLGKDGKGRLLLGGQRGQPLTRLTLHDGKVVHEEVLKLPISEIMGSLWAFDSLYVNGSDGKIFGLYRLRDKNDDGTFEEVELLREWKGGAGEHGAHGIVLGADQKLYTVCGNFVNVPEDVLPSSPHRNYADDLPLPRGEDGNGFGAGKKPPGGFILRMDQNGKNPELFASGERNTYDIAFNADGELFGFDSDMEYDWGSPWYRPIRAFHAISGADHGFREGTGKWPTYYPDSLPPVANVGIGSPTGVMFGSGAKFPVKYQKAFYMLDWTYGRVIAVHMTPQGAGYVGTWENFVAPAGLMGDASAKKEPNNVTDIVIGNDGALYFTTGGRNTHGNLYRVTYTGKEPTTGDLHDTVGAEARAQRHQIEAFQTKEDAKAVEVVWPLLGSEDRTLRYAARIALERQPMAQWKAKALAEKNPQAAITALLSVARLGGKDSQEELFKALSAIPLDALTSDQKLEFIRVVEVTLARSNKPKEEVAQPIVTSLSAMYPAKEWSLNRELCQTLLAMNAPGAVEKTMKLLAESTLQEEQVGYVFYLRTVQIGWTPELRKQYFSWYLDDHKNAGHIGQTVKWFEDAGRPYGNGASFPRFLANFHADAVKTLSADESTALADAITAFKSPAPKKPKPTKKPAVVKAWKSADLAPLLAGATRGRNFDRGKEAFTTGQCLACHKFGNEGGATGPDLTAVSSRFTRSDVLDSIIEPSKVISEQFQNTDVRLKDGDVVSGRILEDKPDHLVVLPDALKPDNKVTVKRADIKSVAPSKLSPMPEGLVNILSKDEILDMIAYMESGGNKNHAVFSK